MVLLRSSQVPSDFISTYFIFNETELKENGFLKTFIQTVIEDWENTTAKEFLKNKKGKFSLKVDLFKDKKIFLSSSGSVENGQIAFGVCRELFRMFYELENMSTKRGPPLTYVRDEYQKFLYHKLKNHILMVTVTSHKVNMFGENIIEKALKELSKIKKAEENGEKMEENMQKIELTDEINKEEDEESINE